MAEIDETRNLIEINKRRLQKLEEQRSRLGYDTPPQILMEIEDIKEAIQQLMLEREQAHEVPVRDESSLEQAQGDRGSTHINARHSAVVIGDGNAVNTSLDLRGANIGELLLHGENKGDTRGGTPPSKIASSPSTSTANAVKAEDGSSRPAALRVFVSYASEDRSAVREVYARLRAQNYEVWFDDENLLPGQDWQVEIRKAVRSAHAIVLFLSKRTVAKAGYIQKEIKYALDVADEQPEGAIFLIPVKLEDCEIPDRLRHLQWVNLYDERGWARLVAALDRRAADLRILSGSS